MRVPTIFDVLALTEALRRKLLTKMGREPGDGLDVRASILNQAIQEFEEIDGRRDAPERVACRELEGVEPTDEDVVLGLGAIKGHDGVWRVPEGMDLAPFESWWPLVPEDLRDGNTNAQLTRSGHLREAYVLIEDEAKGQDSTATSIMYGALPVIAALAFTLSHLTALGYLVVFLAVPYLLAIKQGEGIKDALKAGGLLLLLPLMLTNAGWSAMGGMSGGLGSSPMAFLGSGVVLAVVCVVCAFLFLLKWAEKGLATATDSLVAMVRFTTVLLVLVVLSEVLGQIWAPAKIVWIYALASLYPLYYVNVNYIDRAVRLDAQSKLFNLGTQGVLSTCHVEPKRMQAEAAVKDKSPLIPFGTATGYLHEKQYHFAPLPGVQMVLSLNDLPQHMLIFGKTGGGKTASGLRPTIVELRKTAIAGALILDGKSSLVQEVQSCMDLVIRPGVRFGLFQGMDAVDVTMAFRQFLPQDGGGKDSIWSDGGNMLIEHMNTLLEALHKHEKAFKSYASKTASAVEQEILWLELELIIRRKTGRPDDDVRLKLDVCHERLKAWISHAASPRRWEWHATGLNRLGKLIENPIMVNGSWQFRPELLHALETLGWGVPEDSPRHRYNPESIYPQIGKMGPLDQSLMDLTTSWLSLGGEQRASFFMNVNRLIQPLLRGAKLVDADGTPWHMIEEGEDVTRCLRGEFVGVDLPEVEHGQAGRIVASLVKQRIYSEIKKRAQVGETVWRAQGQLPMMMMIDEAQLLIGEKEREILPIARSLGMFCVFATQTIEGLLATFGSKEQTDHLNETFQNYIVLDTSIATLEYISRRLGYAQLVTYKQRTIGLDYEGGIRNLCNAAVSDLHHPNRSAIRMIARRGGGEFELSAPALRGENGMDWKELRDVKNMDDAARSACIKVPVGGNKEMAPVLSVEELTSLLKAKGTALVLLNRAGAPRVDIVKLNHITEEQARAMPRMARQSTTTNAEEAA